MNIPKKYYQICSIPSGLEVQSGSLLGATCSVDNQHLIISLRRSHLSKASVSGRDISSLVVTTFDNPSKAFVTTFDKLSKASASL
jgi:hypothetical protein